MEHILEEMFKGLTGPDECGFGTGCGGVTPTIWRGSKGLVDDQNFVPLGALGFVTCDGVGKVEWDLVGATGEVRSELFDVEGIEVDRDEFVVDLIEVVTEDVEFFCCCVTSAFTHGDLESVEQVEAA